MQQTVTAKSRRRPTAPSGKAAPKKTKKAIPPEPPAAPEERKTGPLISDMIRKMRESASISQATLARELQVTRSSVNAWEMGLSTPTTQYIVAMAEYFHVTADYLLEINNAEILSLAWEGLQTLGLRDLQLSINSIGCPACRAEYHRALRAYFEDRREELC